jgi:hypothetical protein
MLEHHPEVTKVDPHRPIQESNILGLSYVLIDNADTPEDITLITELSQFSQSLIHDGNLGNYISDRELGFLSTMRRETKAFVDGYLLGVNLEPVAK